MTIEIISFMTHLIVFEFLLLSFPISHFTSPLTSVAPLNQPWISGTNFSSSKNSPRYQPTNLQPTPQHHLRAPPRSAPSISSPESPQCYQQQHSSAQRGSYSLPSPAQPQSLLSARAPHSYNRARGPSQPFQFHAGVAHYGDRRYG
jgi:hypothetical protein